MDYRELLRKSAAAGHKHYRPLRRRLRVWAGGDLQVDADGRGNVSINRRERDQVPKKEEEPPPPEPNCCPEHAPFDADFVWKLWRKHTQGFSNPRRMYDNWLRPSVPWEVVANTVRPFDGADVLQMCVRFFWVCKRDRDRIGGWEMFGSNKRDRLSQQEYLAILEPYVVASPCVSQLYAMEFFGFKKDHDPWPPKHTYHGGHDRYVIYKMI